jgi:1-acyl-sn-glycerol-3-phosphate acyltransferase
MNFLEGTRFTREKHDRQRSPYRYLLRPKAGGIALALNVLGDKFDSLLNITIVYPDGVPSFWEFLSGKLKHVIVRIGQAKVPQELRHGDYEGDEAFRAAFQQWVQQLWQEKDLQIQSLMKEAAATQ